MIFASIYYIKYWIKYIKGSQLNSKSNLKKFEEKSHNINKFYILAKQSADTAQLAKGGKNYTKERFI